MPSIDETRHHDHAVGIDHCCIACVHHAALKVGAIGLLGAAANRS
jgi:hypothetical protein